LDFESLFSSIETAKIRPREQATRVHAVGRELFSLFFGKGHLAVPNGRKSKEQFRLFYYSK